MSWCWTTGARSATAHLPKCNPTPTSSPPISVQCIEGAMNLFLETLIGGLLAGTMYSLVAIGFVLIYKASGVFNFAQGSILLFSALTFVTLLEKGVPFVGALGITIAIIIAGA